MITFGGNLEEVRRRTYELPHTDHGKSSTVDKIWDVGDARGVISLGSGGNTVSNKLFRETAVNCGTVGGFTTNIRS